MIFHYFKNSVEIATLAIFFYYFSLWLKKDEEKNLVWYFYAYCFLFLGSWYTNLFVLNCFILYTGPLIAMLLIIIHQDILQRNFISQKKKISPEKNKEYIEELIRASLAILNTNKNFYCVLEQSAELKPFIKTDFYLQTQLSQPVISYLVESDHFDETKFIWCCSQGKVTAVNGQWKIHHTSTVQDLPPSATQWKEDAILITTKTDACVIKGHAATRSFELVIKGKVHDQLSVHQLLQLLKIQISSPLSGEKIYEQSHKRMLNT